MDRRSVKGYENYLRNYFPNQMITPVKTVDGKHYLATDEVMIAIFLYMLLQSCHRKEFNFVGLPPRAMNLNPSQDRKDTRTPKVNISVRIEEFQILSEQRATKF
jgi:hypothetical protein